MWIIHYYYDMSPNLYNWHISKSTYLFKTHTIHPYFLYTHEYYKEILLSIIVKSSKLRYVIVAILLT